MLFSYVEIPPHDYCMSPMTIAVNDLAVSKLWFSRSKIPSEAACGVILDETLLVPEQLFDPLSPYLIVFESVRHHRLPYSLEEVLVKDSLELRHA